MPIFAAIAAFLARFAAMAFIQVLVMRVLVVLGVGAVSYLGISAIMSTVISAIQSNLSGLPSDVAAILHVASVDRGVSIVLSAVSARLVLWGLTAGGAIKRMVWRGPG